MDDVVLRAMARWPDVPSVYGWLSLDRRGRWRLRGEPLAHRKTCEFIGRNYAADERGRWAFQNGPQCVYVSLDYTPWVLRLRGDAGLETHTAVPVQRPKAVFVDEDGNLLVAFESGIGLVEDRDLEVLSERLCDGHGAAMDPDTAVDALSALAGGACGEIRLQLGSVCLPLTAIRRAEVASRFGYDPRPAPPVSE